MVDMSKVDIQVLVRRIDTGLPIPTYAHQDDAGIDLFARVDAILVPGGGREVIPTGIALAIPQGYAGFVLPRSGLALHHGVTCLNSPGLIDSNYRGEIKVILINTDPTQLFAVSRGERIAQLVIQPVNQLQLTEVTHLGSSSRGAQGFGSTGGFNSTGGCAQSE